MGGNSTRFYVNLIYGIQVHSSSQPGREVRYKEECGAGVGVGISMSCLSCVFLCTVVGKVCSAWPCTYPTRT